MSELTADELAYLKAIVADRDTFNVADLRARLTAYRVLNDVGVDARMSRAEAYELTGLTPPDGPDALT